MGLFKQIAEPLIARNVPVIPLRPKSKIAFLNEWEKQATTDIKKILEWDDQDPTFNGACVAQAVPDGTWFLDIDQPGYADKIEQQTGQKLPHTFAVRTSPGKGHFYFRQTPESIAMGNVKIKGPDGKEVCSARVNNAYVVAPGSIHPSTGLKYETLRDSDILPAPLWLIDWCAHNKLVEPKTGDAELDDNSLIIEGGRNSSLTSLLGKARQVLNMDAEQLFEYGKSLNDKRCRPPLSETEVRTIAYSVGRYQVKPVGKLVFDDPAPVEQVERPIIKAIPYPIFPRWVIKGTSIGDGLIAPICAVNSRYPEFMFMPAMALTLNYLAMKVRIKHKESLIPSFYMVSIGRKGRVIKSSSVNDAVEYLGNAGIIKYAGAIRNAEGKSLVWTVGSTEGLGLEMARTNCKNAVLFYDELSTLTNKAAIEGSTLKSNLLTMYESGQFANTIKSRKETFSFEPRSYCVSLIACTTEKNFPSQWSNMSGGSSGLDERFFFLYQPETLVDMIPHHEVNTVEGAMKTKALIEKAVQKAEFEIADETALEHEINNLGNRTAHRVVKMALFFAIDMGKDEIDEACIERAMAIAKYELAVKRYLATFESNNKDAALQGEIIQTLQRNGGVMDVRELERVIHPMKHGTYVWFRTYNGLIQAGWIAEAGAGTKGNPKMITLMRQPETDE